ncbi:phage-related minor tail protein [Paenibacillus popilliae ATCC 14706]|uniref:Phage-related minor tail protein n=2 Tax=Paenibacillus popilliae TaxID=78057 RepID=M9M4P9_PAEPP|nr:phage-related minor tail protein [Paenibacillus popilliae ATCC 14706]
MRRLVEHPIRGIEIHVDSTQALNDASHLSSQVAARIGRIEADVKLNSTQALNEASRIRSQIASRIGTIEADVQLHVNARLSGAMGSLDTTMDRLRLEIQRLIQTLQNSNGPGGGGGEGDGNSNPLLAIPKGLIAALAGVMATGALIKGTVGGAMEQQQIQGTMQALVGVDASQAEAMLQGIKDIYAAGWGESLTAVGNDIATVRQNLKGLSQEASEAYAQSAYAVEQVARGKTDIGELSKVTRTLMANFQGLDETQALDMITTGFQRGGDYANDLLDTVNEYAVHFAGLGMSAEQMFATLITGSEQGAWNLDKVGDAVKESFIRMQDLSETSKQAFQTLGLDANQMAAQIAAGGETANQAYQATLLALGNMENAIDRNTVGVKLFGTMWEDLEDSVVLAMAEGQLGLGEFEGATKRAADALQNNMGFQLEQFKRNFALGFAESGQGAVEALAPLIAMLNEAFQSGKFQPFFDGLAAGLSFTAHMVSILVENALWLSNVISDWTLIEPVIWGIVGAMGTYLLLTQALTIATKGLAIAINIAKIAQAAFNFVMNMNPFVLIATLIVGIIVALIALWRTNDQFAAALMRGWNAILNFFDRIPAYFWQLVEWLMTPFEWWASSVGKIYDTVINGIIKGINSVLSLINNVTGSSYEIAAEFSYENVAKGVKEYAQIKKDQAYASAAKKAAEREESVKKFLEDRQAKRAKEEAEKEAKNKKSIENNIRKGFGVGKGPPENPAGIDKDIDKVGKVGQVDKIKDKVDISSEDLKLMRELAEMKNIQNFVTLKPSIKFGDTHVRNESDIDTLVTRINEKLENDIASSVDAVYV